MQEENNVIDVNTAEESRGKYAVVGVRFRPCGKVYTFQAEDLDLRPGMRIVVESEMGLSIGIVASVQYATEKSQESLKMVNRIADDRDFDTIQNNRAFQEEARSYCVSRVKDLNLPMKVVTTETTLDRKRLVFYFTADGRIDFRELVRDLAAKFKTRIEMRQIGVRDEVKLLGGIGICGRQTCCSLFLTNFEPVTIKMAKRQDLSINQSKLSGICGRLMCCLGYECKGTSYEAKQTVSAQEEDVITVSEEIMADAAPVISEGEPAVIGQPAEEPTKERQTYRQPEQKSREQGAGQKEGEERRGRRSRRHRHRHKKHAHAQQNQNRPPQEKPIQEGAQKPSEGDNKGKAFSRKRKFWKRKKQQP